MRRLKWKNYAVDFDFDWQAVQHWLMCVINVLMLFRELFLLQKNAEKSSGYKNNIITLKILTLCFPLNTLRHVQARTKLWDYEDIVKYYFCYILHILCKKFWKDRIVFYLWSRCRLFTQNRIIFYQVEVINKDTEIIYFQVNVEQPNVYT